MYVRSLTSENKFMAVIVFECAEETRFGGYHAVMLKVIQQQLSHK
jgi:hypothetical protein